MMTYFGLIGYPLSHSFSEGYFTEKFAQIGVSDQFCYETYPLPQIADLPALIASKPGLLGLNVTIPYKEAVMTYLDELSPAAADIGAVNTILFEDGKLIGYNTDVMGFEESLDDFLMENGGPSANALILGTGGAAKAIAWVLKKKGINFHYVSRNPIAGQWSYQDLNEEIIAGVDLIVNTTPLGMSPNIETCPDIPYHCLGKGHRLYDLVYNPTEPLFLKRGRERGAATLNGLAMLHGQAEAAWSIWRNKEDISKKDEETR
ncbi:MAG: shikimate dehydrogenase family protein [Lewinella sp.]|jgi:shikimate dehydrogenase|uniref:shikimate dehydrogenase family protein n=1 Tax=Lewinella sp. TaxID=2004506 RepID=UPI003D6BEC00